MVAIGYISCLDLVTAVAIMHVFWFLFGYPYSHFLLVFPDLFLIITDDINNVINWMFLWIFQLVAAFFALYLIVVDGDSGYLLKCLFSTMGWNFVVTLREDLSHFGLELIITKCCYNAFCFQSRGCHAVQLLSLLCLCLAYIGYQLISNGHRVRIYICNLWVSE
jgi:hypothetical protein